MSDPFEDIEIMVAAMRTHDTEARLLRVLHACTEIGETPPPERRLHWIDAILAVEDLPAEHRHRLTTALIPLVGPEALETMQSVAVISHDQAAEAVRWSGLALLHATRDAIAAERKQASRDP